MRREKSKDGSLRKESLKTDKNWRTPALQYEHYCFSTKEAIATILLGTSIVGFLAVLFYRSVWAMFFLSPLEILVWKEIKVAQIQKRKNALAEQFKDCLQSVSTNMKAGYSAENAFKESRQDLIRLYGNQSFMVQELEHIVQGLQNNRNLENMLLDLGERSGVNEIQEFGEVFAIAKRSGGNMTEILLRTYSLIMEKMEIDCEIRILISEKRLEQRIMNLVPFLIIIYISITSPGFFDVLYHNAVGIVVMTVCLAVYLISYSLSSNIVNISVE